MREINYKPSSKQQKLKRWSTIKEHYSWSSDVDYKSNPHKYKVGKGEQGVLLCEPYKSIILPYWKFKTPQIAQDSSVKILSIFYKYLQKDEFVGADMARKFLQMGYTRARRYANHKGGLKYDKATGEELPRSPEDPMKAESAKIFYHKWQEAESNPIYKNLKKQWREKYG